MKMSEEKNQFEEDDVYILGNEKIEKQKTSSILEFPLNPDFEPLEVQILDWKNQKNVHLQTHSFELEIKSNTRSWQIQRKYLDFQWLYNALKFSYPGSIFPYFPIKSIEEFMVSKFHIDYGEQRKEQNLLLKKKELQIFISGVCSHDQLKQTEQVKIFFDENEEEFQKERKKIQMQIKESQAEESSSNGIVSLFERGVAWMTSSKENVSEEKIEDIPEWSDTEKDINFWISQTFNLLMKIKNIVEIKEKQIKWEGPETQIDSVQHLKAKVISGRQFNMILVDSLREKILKDLQYEAKNLKQIETHLQERENLINIVSYIRKFTNDENRSNKLIRKKQRLEKSLTNEWNSYRTNLKARMKYVQGNFQKVWKSYCGQIKKIWKNSNQ